MRFSYPMKCEKSIRLHAVARALKSTTAPILLGLKETLSKSSSIDIREF